MPKHYTGIWTKMEFECLMGIISSLKAKNIFPGCGNKDALTWPKVAKMHNDKGGYNRIGKQCREKYFNDDASIKPSKLPWNDDEDIQIIKYKLEGKGWAEISRLIQRGEKLRSPNSIKNHYNSKLRKSELFTKVRKELMPIKAPRKNPVAFNTEQILNDLNSSPMHTNALSPKVTQNSSGHASEEIEDISAIEEPIDMENFLKTLNSIPEEPKEIEELIRADFLSENDFNIFGESPEQEQNLDFENFTY